MDTIGPMSKTGFAVLFLAACSRPTVPTGITSSTLTCPTDSPLTYESFGSAFIADNCLACHASQEQPMLNTQAEIQDNKEPILQAAVYTDAMPQDGDMDLADRQTLGEWLFCGAP